VQGNRESAVSETPWGWDGDSTWVGGSGVVGSLWRYRLVIVVGAAPAAIAGYGTWLLLPGKYKVQASLYLRGPGSPAVLSLGGSTQTGDHVVFLATQTGLAVSDVVYGRALRLLGRAGTPADIRQTLVVGPSADLASITVGYLLESGIRAECLREQRRRRPGRLRPAAPAERRRMSKNGASGLTWSERGFRANGSADIRRQRELPVGAALPPPQPSTRPGATGAHHG